MNAGDVNDQRVGDVLRANHLELAGVSSLTRLLLGGQQYSGQTYSGLARANDTESFWSEGDLIGIDNTFDDTQPNGTWWLDVLKAWSQVWTEQLRTRAASTLELVNAGGTAFLPFVGKNTCHAFGTFSYSQSNNRFELKSGWNFETNGTRTGAGIHTVELTNKTLTDNEATVFFCKSNLGTAINHDQFSVTASGTAPNVNLLLNYFDNSSGNKADPPASPNQEFFIAVFDANAIPS